MAININGSGTITGVSVGGLPDGIVDTDMIATSAVTGAKIGSLPTGSILQVVQTVKTDTTSTTSTSFTDISGVSVSITPSSTSNKILVIPDLALSSQSIYYARLLRGSTVIYAGSGTHAGFCGGYGGDPGGGVFDYGLAQVSRLFLDSPATTSAVTYKCQYKTYANTIYLNNTRHSGGVYDIPTQSSITVIEVAA